MTLDTVIGLIGIVIALLQVAAAQSAEAKRLLIVAGILAIGVVVIAFGKNSWDSYQEERAVASSAAAIYPKFTGEMTFEEIYNSSYFQGFNNVNESMDYLVREGKLAYKDTTATLEDGTKHKVRVYYKP